MTEQFSRMILIFIGLVTYIGTAALGTSAQMGLVNTHSFRWLHHVLYALVLLTLGGAVLVNRNMPYLLALIPVCLCMIIQPAFRAGTRRHCWNATVGLACYIGALVWAIGLSVSAGGS
jgi:hypothetical protein